MEMRQKRRFFANHSKSSAAVVSIALHLILLLIAGTFVAVTVVTKGEQNFETLQIVREENAPKLLTKSGTSKKKKDRFSLNVIFFAPEEKVGPVGQYEMLAKRCNGGFRLIKGPEAIESSVSE